MISRRSCSAKHRAFEPVGNELTGVTSGRTTGRRYVYSRCSWHVRSSRRREGAELVGACWWLGQWQEGSGWLRRRSRLSSERRSHSWYWERGGGLRPGRAADLVGAADRPRVLPVLRPTADHPRGGPAAAAGGVLLGVLVVRARPAGAVIARRGAARRRPPDRYRPTGVSPMTPPPRRWSVDQAGRPQQGQGSPRTGSHIQGTTPGRSGGWSGPTALVISWSLLQTSHRAGRIDTCQRVAQTGCVRLQRFIG
jgi:hypothetical protein